MPPATLSCRRLTGHGQSHPTGYRCYTGEAVAAADVSDVDRIGQGGEPFDNLYALFRSPSCFACARLSDHESLVSQDDSCVSYMCITDARVAKGEAGMTSKWVTRERPKIDRIACPWLIRRFVAKEAEFIYVPTEQVFAVAKETGATPYDIPGAEPFSHHGEQCSFDAFLDHYELHEPALDRLAVIVRGADTARLDLAPQAAGLLAISLGLSANFADDHAMLEQGMVVYDGLYTWCRSLQHETHNWTPPP